MILRDIETGKLYDVWYDDFGGMFSCGWKVEEVKEKHQHSKKDKRSRKKRKLKR